MLVVVCTVLYFDGSWPWCCLLMFDLYVLSSSVQVTKWNLHMEITRLALYSSLLFGHPYGGCAIVGGRWYYIEVNSILYIGSGLTFIQSQAKLKLTRQKRLLWSSTIATRFSLNQSESIDWSVGSVNLTPTKQAPLSVQTPQIDVNQSHPQLEEHSKCVSNSPSTCVALSPSTHDSGPGEQGSPHLSPVSS